MVGGATWSRIASTENTASTPPAAPSRCPVIDLVELTASFLRVIAEAALDRDGLGDVAQRRRGAVRVDVVDVLGVRARALRSAFAMQRAAPSPSSGGAVMW